MVEILMRERDLDQICGFMSSSASDTQCLELYDLSQIGVPGQTHERNRWRKEQSEGEGRGASRKVGAKSEWVVL